MAKDTSGTISTQNLVPAGVATDLSAVQLDSVEDYATMMVQVAGTYTGDLSLQGTIDGKTWITILGAVFVNMNTGAVSAAIPSGSTGIWRTNVAGFIRVRVTALAAVTGSAAVGVRLSSVVFPNPGLLELMAGENISRDRLQVEHKYPPLKVTADTLVLTGPGVLHSVILTCNDAAPTAGSIILYDSLTEANTEIFNHTFTTTPFTPVGFICDFAVLTGLFAGFTTTNDVNLFVGVL